MCEREREIKAGGGGVKALVVENALNLIVQLKLGLCQKASPTPSAFP